MLRDIRLAIASYSSTRGTDKLNSYLPLSINDSNLNEAPRFERKAEIKTHVSITIDVFTLVLYVIPINSQQGACIEGLTVAYPNGPKHSVMPRSYSK